MAVSLRPLDVPSVLPAQAEPEIAPKRVANLIVETLRDLGVDTFYGIPGGAIASLYDALLDYPELKIVNTRHETGAAFMAMGQAKVGGTLPCVLMTSGPGITNAITGLAAAFADGVPMIAIGGEVPRRNFGRGALQEGSRYQLDVLGMVRSVTKLAVEVANPRAASTLVRKAVATALSGRQGPVFLSLPLDVANERVRPVRTSSSVSTQFEIDRQMLDESAAALQASERGLILVGSGARHPEAVRWIGAVASTLQLPVMTTPKAKGLFPESDALSLGVFGLGGHPSATRYLEQGFDTLLCIGCGLGETGTNSWSPVLQPSRTFIQIDIDAAQIGKNYHCDFGLVGPSHVVLRELASRLNRRPANSLISGVEYHPIEPRAADAQPLTAGHVVQHLQSLMPSNTIYTSDIGEHSLFAIHYLRIDQPDGFVINTGLGSMGSGIGAAIGAKQAHPERPVVSICGDFGFQMIGMELATCVQSKLPVVFAIFNDARMRMVESGQSNVFGRPGLMHSHRIDFATIARGMGAIGLRIDTLEQLQAAGPQIRNTPVPVVLDISVDADSKFPVNGRVTQLRHFSSRQVTTHSHGNDHE